MKTKGWKPLKWRKKKLCSVRQKKTINNYPPEYLRDLFWLSDNIKNLRGVNKLQVPKPNTTRFNCNIAYSCRIFLLDFFSVVHILF